MCFKNLFKTGIIVSSNVYRAVIRIKSKGGLVWFGFLPRTGPVMVLKITRTEEILLLQGSFHIYDHFALVRPHLQEYVGFSCKLRIQRLWKQ